MYVYTDGHGLYITIIWRVFDVAVFVDFLRGCFCVFLVCVRGGGEIYSSEHTFFQHRGTGLPAIEAITFGLYIMIRNWNVMP